MYLENIHQRKNVSQSDTDGSNSVMIVSVSKTVWVDPVINIMHMCLSVKLSGVTLCDCVSQ